MQFCSSVRVPQGYLSSSTIYLLPKLHRLLRDYDPLSLGCEWASVWRLKWSIVSLHLNVVFNWKRGRRTAEFGVLVGLVVTVDLAVALPALRDATAAGTPKLRLGAVHFTFWQKKKQNKEAAQLIKKPAGREEEIMEATPSIWWRESRKERLIFRSSCCEIQTKQSNPEKNLAKSSSAFPNPVKLCWRQLGRINCS